MTRYALYNHPRPEFAGSERDYDMALSIWQSKQGVLRILRGADNVVVVQRCGNVIKPIFSLWIEHITPIVEDEYSAEWLAAS